MHSAGSLLWRDGEVLRHSAALSCWHRKMGGLGSPWKARVRLDYNWIGRVQLGLAAPWTMIGACGGAGGAGGRSTSVRDGDHDLGR